MVCTLLIFITSAVFSQQTTSEKPLTKQDYLQKSKSQRTAAWILLGAGTTMIAIAAPGNVSFDILPVLAIGGGAAVLGSIPLFIAAGRNKRKAMTISSYIELQHNSAVTYRGLTAVSFPALALKLRF